MLNAKRKIEFILLQISQSPVRIFLPLAPPKGEQLRAWHQISNIQYQVSNIQYQVSSIQHPASSIQHQVSTIKYTVHRRLRTGKLRK